jgi:hypothetical protein
MAIALLQKLLILALQVVLENDTVDVRAPVPKALGFASGADRLHEALLVLISIIGSRGVSAPVGTQPAFVRRPNPRDTEEQRVRISRHLTIYFVATVALWTVVLFTGQCWMWQKAHQIPSMVMRDFCQNAWQIACGVLAIVQLIALGDASFGSRVLSRRSRVILAICGLVGLLTNPMLLILLLMPEIH